MLITVDYDLQYLYLGILIVCVLLFVFHAESCPPSFQFCLEFYIAK